MAYEFKIAQDLAEASSLAYTQYANGTPPGNDGKITPPAGYVQIPGANFTAPELDISQILAHLGGSVFSGLQVTDLSAIRTWLLSLFGIKAVYFGFVLQSVARDKNVFVFRGTKSTQEWALNAAVPQVELPSLVYQEASLRGTKVHLGFLVSALLLMEQVLDATKQVDMTIPCYFTGHSLGGALAVLLGLLVKGHYPHADLHMYSYAAPRVGDPAFAAAYDGLLPESYRVVNLSDVVPIVPPTNIGGWVYTHVAKNNEWSFLNQTEDVGSNHSFGAANIYLQALAKGVVVNIKRTYPVMGV